MQVAEYNPKRIQDQQDVAVAVLSESFTILWNGEVFEARQATFADLGGSIAVEQLPPGSIAAIDTIDEDALYFFDDSDGAPRLITAAEAADFLDLSFANIGGTIAVEQLPPGSVASLDTIDEDALYFFDDATGEPRLISAAEAADFISQNLSFGDISGTIAPEQFPADTVVTIDSIDEDGFYFFDNTLFVPKLISVSDAATLLGVGGGSGVVDGQQLFDVSHVLSMDAGARKFYATDGTTEMLSWQSGNLMTVMDNASDGSSFNIFGTGVTAAQFFLNSGVAELYIDRVLNMNGDAGSNIDLLNRKLYDSSGHPSVYYDSRVLATPLSVDWPDLAWEVHTNPNGYYSGGSFRYSAGSVNAGSMTLDWDATSGVYVLEADGGVYVFGSSYNNNGKQVDVEFYGEMTLTQFHNNDYSTNVHYAYDKYLYDDSTGWGFTGGEDVDNNPVGSPQWPIGAGLPHWPGDSLATPTPKVKFTWAGGSLLSDSVGNWSVDAGNRTLRGRGGVVAASWDDNIFIAPRIGNSAAGENIRVSDRKLYASDGTTEMMDWSNPNALTFGNAIEVNVSTGSIYLDNLSNDNGDALANIDLLNRRLYQDDGTTVVLSWFDEELYHGGEMVLGWGSQYLQDENGTLSINWDDRKLYNPDGTTVAIDYGLDNAFVRMGVSGLAEISTDSDPTGGQTGGQYHEVYIRSGGIVLDMIDDEGTKSVTIEGLPTSDPVVTNQLWNSGGIVALSGFAGIDLSGYVPTSRTVNGHALSSNVTVTPTDLGLVIGTNVQSWDADLDALSALTGTNTIYYRSAANTWSAVAMGTAITFSSGTLNVTGVTNVSATTPIISSGGTTPMITIQPATSGQAGYMSAADKTKLDGIDLSGYQPLDSDLTTLAGLTATTDNFIVSVSSAWASRTPSQVRTTLGLVIGTNVQAWDADIDSWAAISRASGFDTFVATPSSANLAALITDETGSGALVFGTSPTLTTPLVNTISSVAGNAFTAQATASAQAAGALAGVDASFKASDAVAGSSTVGAAAGGNVTVQAGDAKRLTSGNAAGGDVTLGSGGPVGTGTAGLIFFKINASTKWKIDASGNFIAQTDNAVDIGASAANRPRSLYVGTDVYTNNAAALIRTKATLTGGGTGSVPTLLAGPVAGDPTKWIPIDDNGTTRYIPAW